MRQGQTAFPRDPETLAWDGGAAASVSPLPQPKGGQASLINQRAADPA